MLRKSCMEHDFRVNIDRCVQPNRPFFSELNLFLVDSDSIRVGGELLIVVLGVGLVGSIESLDAVVVGR